MMWSVNSVRSSLAMAIRMGGVAVGVPDEYTNGYLDDRKRPCANVRMTANSDIHESRHVETGEGRTIVGHMVGYAGARCQREQATARPGRRPAPIVAEGSELRRFLFRLV